MHVESGPCSSRLVRRHEWEEQMGGKSRGVSGRLLTHTSEIPLPGDPAGAVFSWSSLLCVCVRALGFFFPFIQRVKPLPLEFFPFPSPICQLSGSRDAPYPVSA